MQRPNRRRQSATIFNKFAFIFGLLMTVIYLALGLFIIFSDSTDINLNIPQNIKILLGGTFILYGIVRFIRVYQTRSKSRNDRFSE